MDWIWQTLNTTEMLTITIDFLIQVFVDCIVSYYFFVFSFFQEYWGNIDL